METKQKAVVALFITLGVLVGFLMGAAFMYGAIVAGAEHIAEKLRVEQVTIGLNESALAQAVTYELDKRGWPNHSVKLCNATLGPGGC